VGTIGCGTITSTGNLIIANAGNIGSIGDIDAIAISAAGEVTMSGQPAFLAYVDTQQNNVTGDNTAYSVTGAFRLRSQIKEMILVTGHLPLRLQVHIFLRERFFLPE